MQTAKIIRYRHPATSAKNQISRIPLAKIRESIVTLRTQYDNENLGELAGSLEEQGQLQMIIVQMTDDGFYELIIGSRRIRATKLKGDSDIDALVIEPQSPADMLIMALAENLHRSDLNPFEEAQGFLRLMKDYELSYPQIAQRINKPESYIRGRIQLLSMPEKVIGLVSGKTLPLGHIRPLVRLPDGDSQVRLAELAVKNNLSQTELNALVQKELRQPTRRNAQPKVLTPLKVITKVGQFLEFLLKVPKELQIDSMNASERQELIQALTKLGEQSMVVQKLVFTRSVPVSEVVRKDPDNQGQEWTVKEMQRIISSERPSDEVLSKELGRSIVAIRSMRTKMAASA